MLKVITKSFLYFLILGQLLCNIQQTRGRFIQIYRVQKLIFPDFGQFYHFSTLQAKQRRTQETPHPGFLHFLIVGQLLLTIQQTLQGFIQQQVPHINFSVIFGLILPFFKVLGLWWTWIKFFRHGSDTKVVALYVMSMIGKFQQNRRTLIFLSRRLFWRPGRGGMSRKSL